MRGESLKIWLHITYEGNNSWSQDSALQNQETMTFPHLIYCVYDVLYISHIKQRKYGVIKQKVLHKRKLPFFIIWNLQGTKNGHIIGTELSFQKDRSAHVCACTHTHTPKGN